MNPQILGLRVASIIFGLMSLAQLVRLVIRPEVIVAGHQDAAVAKRAGLHHFGRPEHLDVETRSHADQMSGAEVSVSSFFGGLTHRLERTMELLHQNSARSF